MSADPLDDALTSEQREARAQHIDAAVRQARAAYNAAAGCRCGRALSLLDDAISELRMRAHEVRGTVPR